ncbi:unnamed protein product [Lymnaea stagnalis]|uniref:Uncharacterized protein n=1 Tax=Lymnaea stagnalis TaxID=6523 RepID=A0AAV2HIT3_LYMST
MEGRTLFQILAVLTALWYSAPWAECVSFSSRPLSEDDYLYLQTLPDGKAGQQLPGFKYLYVDEDRQTNETLDHSRVQLEIAGSPGVSDFALRVAADYVIKMTQYMPDDIFRNVATRSSLGIFSAHEKLIVFPEYAHLANGDCGTSCLGSCAHTCSADGRKWENVAGVGGKRAVILEDNILCTPHDPYYHNLNVLVHEYTHTIHANGLGPQALHNITAAYHSAKEAHTWTVPSYAMGNEREYFAVATTVFFAVNRNGLANSGGMNSCGSGFCTTEAQGREHLSLRDPALYGALSYVFTDNNPDLHSGLTICPHSNPVVVG